MINAMWSSVLAHRGIARTFCYFRRFAALSRLIWRDLFSSRCASSASSPCVLPAREFELKTARQSVLRFEGFCVIEEKERCGNNGVHSALRVALAQRGEGKSEDKSGSVPDARALRAHFFEEHGAEDGEERILSCVPESLSFDALSELRRFLISVRVGCEG